MQTTPKIMVFRLKEVLMTAAFIILTILLVLLLIFLFLPSKEKKAAEEYTSGTYTASLVLNSVPMEVSVLVDDDCIKSVELLHLNDSVSAMYPLLEPSLSEIEDCLAANESLDTLTFDDDNTYTGAVLRDAVSLALSKAKK